jgi:hypothetical protein
MGHIGAGLSARGGYPPEAAREEVAIEDEASRFKERSPNIRTPNLFSL